MKHSALSSLSVLSLLIGTLSLAGCGGAFSMPDAGVSNPVVEASGPPVQGSVFGGHAPIQGAHVYLLQPSVTAYGGLATSLLGNNGATSAGSYVLTTNVNDPHVPTTGTVPKYVTTDANGEFNLTGAYTCVVGQPVYIYAYGGNIGSTTGSTPVTLTITSASVSHVGSVYTYTFHAANTGSTPLAAGNSVTLALTNGAFFSGTNWTALNGAQTVATANSTQFTVTGTNHAITGTATGTATYNVGTSSAAVNNVSIVQLLTLGICPSSGNFSTPGNGAINYVYLNEVSSVVTAYTFQPFTIAANNDAWHIGSSGSTQALLGIANAADTAAQLYNIQGSTTLISTSFQGEGHLANYLTTNSKGIVPQATIDTLANILANCVDSVPSSSGAVTSTCNSLFSIATADGSTTGTKPTDTGTAAMYIARYPAGNNSLTADANYASDIFGIQTTIFPYVPDLQHAPNDWTIAINYPTAGRPIDTSYTGVTNAYFAEAESLSIDALGQIWITAQGEDSIVRIDHTGTIQPSTAQSFAGYIYGYVSVDGGGNAWTGSANSTQPIFRADVNGQFTINYGSGYVDSYTNIADNAGNDYFFASGGSAGAGMYEYPAGAGTGSTPNHYALTSSGFSASNNVAHGAIDADHNFWLTSETDSGFGSGARYQIAKVNSTGTNQWLISTNAERPEFVAIDSKGTGWIPNQAAAGPIYKITTGGVSTSLTSGSTGATLSNPFGSAVDGNGNVWITNRCGAYNSCTTGHNSASSTLIELNGTGNSGTVNTAISPATNYLPETQYAGGSTFTAILPDPLNLAIDPSGNIWITNYTGNAATGSVVEIVGSAAPVVTPLSAAAGTNKLGQKP